MSVAHAESWCATPLIAHEWGVQVLRTDGAAPTAVEMPPWLHTRGPAQPSAAAPVRHLPADTGIRTLPVVQFYAPQAWGPEIPLAVEVGFTEGRASLWYPQVDRLVPAEATRSAEAERARSALVAQRRHRTESYDFSSTLGPDPTRQLGWDSLVLSRTAPDHTQPATVPWVEALRDVPGALWVSAGEEHERFLFYEADTTEQPALVLERGSSWAPGRPHYVLRNRADWDVHDVVIVADGRAWTAPRIPAGATAGFLLDTALDAEGTAAWLRERWTDADAPTPPEAIRWGEDCVMMRDPAVPTEDAADHRLYAAEVDVLLGVWSGRLLEDEGVHVVYREDTDALDTLMPASLYTDMYHHINWRRLGVVLVEGMALP